ncbi:TIGR02300 family protein [Rhodoblastus acidophilus]|uniref:TIGR02300 family protein n=1 Tax=Rhodoblastus acidophilus TaxID=1074 RepID=A0A6N8DP75_RHOAC|nr:TIGR02300 family protein [Rhodoblastus acidophilus]MTV30584.1 TIGR02300 family protein [Rhodoblastus acidophilus]
MTEALRGEKRLCLNCAAKFFDLAKDPIKCPKCGAVFEPVPLPRSPPRRVGGAFAHKPFETQAAVVEETEEDVKVSDGEQDEDDEDADERPATAEEA